MQGRLDDRVHGLQEG